MTAADEQGIIRLRSAYPVAETLDRLEAALNRSRSHGETLLPVGRRGALIARLDRVRSVSHELGYGVGDDMDYLWTKYAKQSH